MADKTLAVEVKKPWLFLADFNSDATTSTASHLETPAKPNWRCLLDKVRTFFAENPAV
jgi:hypothetical protein